MTDEINLRFNALNTELVGSFDSFAGVQSSFKQDSANAFNEMAKVRNQMDTMDRQLAKDFKTLAERMRNLEFQVLNSIFDKNHQRALNLGQKVNQSGLGGVVDINAFKPFSPLPEARSNSSLPLLNDRRSNDNYNPTLNQHSSLNHAQSSALPLTSKSELVVP